MFLKKRRHRRQSWPRAHGRQVPGVLRQGVCVSGDGALAQRHQDVQLIALETATSKRWRCASLSTETAAAARCLRIYHLASGRFESPFATEVAKEQGRGA